MFLHSEPSLDDLSLRSDVITPIKVLSLKPLNPQRFPQRQVKERMTERSQELSKGRKKRPVSELLASEAVIQASILYETGVESKISGDAVYYTIFFYY